MVASQPGGRDLYFSTLPVVKGLTYSKFCKKDTPPQICLAIWNCEQCIQPCSSGADHSTIPPPPPYISVGNPSNPGRRPPVAKRSRPVLCFEAYHGRQLLCLARDPLTPAGSVV